MSNLGGRDFSEDTDKNNTQPSGQVDSVQAGTDISVDNTDPANPVVSSTVVPGGQVDSVQAGTNVTVDNTDPANPIVSATGGGGSLPTTTKGDFVVHNGTTDVRLPVGTDGQVLEADSAQAEGVKWATPSGGGSSDQRLYYNYEEASGVDAEAIASGARGTVGLNTVKHNGITSATTDTVAHTFTLPAGSYEIAALLGVWSTYVSGGENGSRINIYNVTDATDAIIGVASTALADAGERSGTTLTLDGYVVIAAPKTFRLEVYRHNSNGSTPLVHAVGEAGVEEVYATLKVKKVA